jgi:hypothetical protein
MRKLGVVLWVVILVARVWGEDPVKVLPQAYQFEFENDWVKVVRVHYAAKVKLPEHDHTEFAAAYVYLNDSGPILFKHINLAYAGITRPAVKARSFRIWPAVKEIHAVENPNDTPSDFLRIELKTEVRNRRTFAGRFPALEYPPDENFEKMQFEDEQARITRLACAPGKPCLLAATGSEPALFVPVATARLKVRGSDGASSTMNLEAGKVKWMDAGRKEQIENVGSTPAEFLRIDFITRPMPK